jgi:hypothetical protein
LHIKHDRNVLTIDNDFDAIDSGVKTSRRLHVLRQASARNY